MGIDKEILAKALLERKLILLDDFNCFFGSDNF